MYGTDRQDRPVLTLVDRPYIDPLVHMLGNLFRDSLDRALADLLADLIDPPFRDQPPDREVIVL